MMSYTIFISMCLFAGVESLDSSKHHGHRKPKFRTSPSISEFDEEVAEMIADNAQHADVAKHLPSALAEELSSPAAQAYASSRAVAQANASSSAVAQANVSSSANKSYSASLSHSYYSPDGDVICTSLDQCTPWDPDAWKHATNDCSQTVVYSGPGLQGIPKDITVFFDTDLNGGGTLMTAPFYDTAKAYLKNHSGIDRNGKGIAPFRRGYEWCTGPGFIAFAQLAAGMVGRLFLSDINPKAVKCVHKTIEYNKLQGIVEVYLGKDFTHMPVPKEYRDKIDVVWGNPPNYYSVDAKSPYYKQLRPSDPGWKTHKAFYAGIRPYLRDDALLLIEEVLPENKEVTYADLHIPQQGNYDVRPEVPLKTFKNMAVAAGFKQVGLEKMDIWNGVSSVLLFEVIPHAIATPKGPTPGILGHFKLPLVVALLLALTAACGGIACTTAWKKVTV